MASEQGMLQLLQTSPPSPAMLPLLRETFRDAADFETLPIGEIGSQSFYLCYLNSLVGSDHLVFRVSESSGPLDETLEKFHGTKYAPGDFTACEKALCNGQTILCTSDSYNGIILETSNIRQRGLQQPLTENVIQGPMYALNEDYNTNVAIMRQRMKTSKLKLWEISIGTVTPTRLGVMHLEGITNPLLIQRTHDMLSALQTDGAQDTGQLLRLLTTKATLFPLAVTTERPDRLAASLLKGKLIVLLDGTPFSIIAPGAFSDFWQSAEDYYLTPFIALFLRMLRFAALMINLFLPALYVAITSVNIDVNRLEISLAASASREGVPYPVFVETILMLFLLDCMVEAGVRLPKSISSTVTMVGGVVLGQAIIQANIVSNLLVIVAATTALTNFIVIDYQMGLVQRILKYFVLMGAGMLGVLGIVICSAILVICLSRMESFGVSYLTPIGPRARIGIKSLDRGGFSFFRRNSAKERRNKA